MPFFHKTPVVSARRTWILDDTDMCGGTFRRQNQQLTSVRSRSHRIIRWHSPAKTLLSQLGKIGRMPCRSRLGLFTHFREQYWLAGMLVSQADTRVSKPQVSVERCCPLRCRCFPEGNPDGFAELPRFELPVATSTTTVLPQEGSMPC